MSWQFKQTYPAVSKSNRVLNYISKPFHCCLGKASPWPNINDTPLDIDPDIRSIPEPLIYFPVFNLLPAIRSPCGNKTLIDSNGAVQSWYIFYEDPGHPYNPTHVYVSIQVKDKYLMADTYRCIGLYSGLILNEGVTESEYYLPQWVKDPGVLEWVCFHSPIEKVQGRTTRTIDFMMGF